MVGPIARIRRYLWSRKPFPPEWEKILARRLWFYRHYPPELAARFRTLVYLFAREKHFIGAGDWRVDDDQRVTISGCAMRLALFLGIEAYDRLTEIIVYPHAFRRPEDEGIYLGEAHDWGTVVLSWPAVLEGLRRPCDGHDTALHEFAHVLDRASGYFDGTPNLRRGSDYDTWARVMTAHFERLRAGMYPERTVLRPYGAENEAEFFAVCTEAFFERPAMMRRQLPELYDLLRGFYGFDPAEHPWCAGLQHG